MNIYALMSADGTTVIEYRASTQPLVVGPGAQGEYARMVPATPAQIAALAASAPVPVPQLDAVTLAAALIAKGVLAQADITSAVQTNAGATLATAVAATPVSAPLA